MNTHKLYTWITISGRTRMEFIGTNIQIQPTGQTVIYKDTVMIAIIPRRAFILRGKEVIS